MHSRAGRLLRGGLTGAVATVTAALSHAVAGGMPSGLALGTGLLFGAVFGTLAIGRRTTLPRLAVVIAGTQVAFHLVFSYLTPATGTVVTTGHHATVWVDAVPVVEPDVAMWAAHVVAGVLTLWFVRRGEAVVWRILRDALLRVLVLLVPVVAAPPRLPVAARTIPVHVAVAVRLPRRRGPPSVRFA